MWRVRLAREIGDLAQNDSPGVALDRMSAAAARRVPGCTAALVVLWREVIPGGGKDGRRHVVVDYGASHPDIATAFECQYALGQGPALAALDERDVVSVTDALREDRWPRFTSTAVRCGDRSSVTFPLFLQESAVTFGIHSGRAGAFEEEVVTPLLALLAEQVATALHTADLYSDAAREAAHMRRALTSRSVIDQAKGILMHAHGYDAAEAFEELRRVAQHNRLKVAEVASRLVGEHAESSETAPGSRNSGRPQPGPSRRGHS